MEKLWVPFVIIFSVITGGISNASTNTSSQPVRILQTNQTQAELKTYLRKHVPEFIPPADSDAWSAQSETLRQQLIDDIVLRGVPDEWLAEPTQVVWGETIAMDKYLIRKLRYQVVPKLWVGALLYEPTSLKNNVPAVLNTNGHVGKLGMSIPYKQIRCINLAKRGILALSLEWIEQGQLSKPGYNHNELAYLDLCGRSGVAIMYLSLKRGLDILCDHPNTDPQRIAVTGLSGGGWQTIFISSLDKRVTLMAPNAGYIGLGNRIEHISDIGDIEQNPCDMLTLADYPHLTAMFAPRPALLIYNQNDDCCFMATRARASVYEPIVPVYELFGCPENFAFHINYDPGTHNYEKDNRQAFYRFLYRHFLPQNVCIDDDIPCENEILTQQELAITYPIDNADFHTLAREAMQNLPLAKRSHGNNQAQQSWRKQTRERLITILRPETLPLVRQAPLKSTPIPDSINGAQGHAYRLKKDGNFTIPLVTYRPKNDEPTGISLILADKGRSDVHGIIRRQLKQQHRVIVADLLFTGECQPTHGNPGLWGMMIAAVGKRPLGIQFNQLLTLIPWIKDTFPNEPLHIITKGRVTGLAALTFAALNPKCVNHIQHHQMDKSLKHLLNNKVYYGHAPSLFCFGLLKLVDIPELIDLAAPTKIEFSPSAVKP